MYQILRRTLSEIQSSIPAELRQFRETIRDSIPQITDMEIKVNRSLSENVEPEDALEFDTTLNAVQQELETLQSNTMYLDDIGGS